MGIYKNAEFLDDAYAFRVILSEEYYEEHETYKIFPTFDECVNCLMNKKISPKWAFNKRPIRVYYRKSLSDEYEIDASFYIDFKEAPFLFNEDELKKRAQTVLDGNIEYLKNLTHPITGCYISTDFNEIYTNLLAREKALHEESYYSYRLGV